MARDPQDERALSAHDANQDAEATLTTTAALCPRYDRLTRANTVLLLIDHQIGPLWDLEFSASRRQVVGLARIARNLQLPTIVTTIAPETWGPLIPELAVVIPEEHVIVRHTANAWEDANVRAAIDGSRRKKLIIAGSVAEVGVAVCALAAVRAGYEVYAPIDASGQCSHPALVRLSRAGVIVTTTALVTGELVGEGPGTHSRTTRTDAMRNGRRSETEALKERLRVSRTRRDGT